MLQLYTIGREFSAGKIVPVKCVCSDSLERINIKDKSFLLVILEEGSLTFEIKDKIYDAKGPCFLCFDETANPYVLKRKNIKARSIYFHPQFININMRLDFIRSQGYFDFAFNHDLFLLEPFMSDTYVIPLHIEYLERINECYLRIKENLEMQRDILWSCRARSYFMEVIIVIERLYDVIRNLESSEPEYHEFVKKALTFIENHYGEDISLSDIIKASESNHTTLGKLFGEELNMTPMKYLWYYRILIAKKHLSFTDIPLKEIAFRCGFKTVSHFSRVFKEHTGKSPLMYRKSAVEERKASMANNVYS